MPCNGPCVITHYFSNGTVNLLCGALQIKYNIRRIKPHKSDTKVDHFSQKNMSDDVNICLTISTYDLPVIYFYLKSKLGTKYIIRWAQGQ